MKNLNYLQNIPLDNSWGICKVLLVRREIIHLKHIRKEIFIRRTVNIHEILRNLNISLFEYIQYLTNKENLIFKFNRDYTLEDPNQIIKLNNTFGQYLILYQTLKKVVIYSDNHYSIFKFLKIDPIIIVDIRNLPEITQKDNISIFVSKDMKKLETAWVFGIKTFTIINDKISHFSLKTDN